MPNPENIVKHKFKPGQSGNPKGRPHKLPDLAELMAEMLGEEKDGKTAAIAIVAAMRAKAAKGDVAAARWVFEYAYGKPIETVNQNINTNGPLIIDWSNSPDEKKE